jgi:hypothetical protein
VGQFPNIRLAMKTAGRRTQTRCASLRCEPARGAERRNNPPQRGGLERANWELGQLTARQIGSNEYFEVANHPGTTPFVDTRAFFGTNPEALFLDRRSLGNNGQRVRNGYITSKGWRGHDPQIIYSP